MGLLCPLFAMAGGVTSPNGKLTAIANGKVLTVSYKKKQVLEINDLLPADQSFTFVRKVHDDYQMLSGKRLHCTNEANEYRCGNLVLRMYNDGIAFRAEGQHPTPNTQLIAFPKARDVGCNSGVTRMRVSSP